MSTFAPLKSPCVSKSTSASDFPSVMAASSSPRVAFSPTAQCLLQGDMCAKLMERSHVTNTCRVRTFNLERVFEHADRTHAPLPFCCQIQVKHLWSALRLVWCLQTDDNMSSKQKRESQRVDRRVFSVGRPSSRRQQVPDLGNVHAACHRHDLPGCSLGRCFQHWARSSEDFSTAGPVWGFMNSAQQTRYVARSAVSGKL